MCGNLTNEINRAAIILLREAAIILPIRDTRGNPTETYRRKFVEALILAFGGVTVTNAEGYWRSPSGQVVAEPVKIYTVAAPATGKSADTLQRLAAEACIALAQEAIYLRYHDGEVVLLTAEHAKALTT